MEVLNHFVFVLDVLFDAVEVVRSAAEVLLLEPVRIVLLLFGNRENVLDGVRHDEIFVRFQSMHRLLMDLGNCIFFVSAVIGEVPH